MTERVQVQKGMARRASLPAAESRPQGSMAEVPAAGRDPAERTAPSPVARRLGLHSVQRAAGNRAATRLYSLAGPRRPPRSIQRHSDDELKAQVDPALDPESVLQARHDPALAARSRLLRHPIQPPADSLKAARMPFRKVDQARRLFQDKNLQEEIRQGLRRFAHSTLAKAEFDTKRVEIDKLEWLLDDSGKQPNPAQAGAAGITIFYKHENYYFPDGSVRTEFIKSVMIHEALHAVSLNSTGFQGLDYSYTKGLKSDSVDEAVTDRLGSEIAGAVLGQAEKYTSQYWNVLGRKGLDFHLTSRGLETLANSNPSVWLGDLVDIITAATGLTWAQIKKGYLSNDQGAHDSVTQAINGKKAEIEAEWTRRRRTAFQALLGPDAVDGPTWESKLTEAVKALDGAAAQPVNHTADQVRALLEVELRARTGADHTVVPKSDRRSSSKDDWAIVNKVAKTNNFVKPPGPGWKPAGTGMLSSPAARGAEELAVQQAKAAKPQHVKEFSAGTWAAVRALEQHVKAAQKLLKLDPKTPNLSWVLIPTPEPADDQDQAKVGDRLETYLSSQATGLLDPKNKGETLGTLTGDDPKQFAHATVAGYGGAGYEANGDIAFVTQEHTNLATVAHEMGHHKQKHEGLSEETVGAIPKLLDFHNMILNENKLAADDIRSGRDADPYVRLRYTDEPARLRVSQWTALANAKADKESDAYAAFRDRMLKRGGAYGRLVQEIEAELASSTAIYPGKISILFKNYMIDEIKRSKPEVEFSDAS